MAEAGAGSADRAGTPYWDSLWQGSSIPRAVDPRRTGMWYAPNRRFHRYYASEVFAGLDTRNKRLLEIGAARSEWLPYFAQTWGFAVTGLDYSAVGAEQCRQVLATEQVDGDVVCADFRTPPDDMKATFDVVTSYGVIEHFDDTSRALADAAAFLRPGGRLITVVPNMTGLIGVLQKTWNRPIFDIHVALDRPALMSAHRQAGLKVRRCDYLILLPFGVANLNGLPETLNTRIKRLLHYAMQLTNPLMWWVDERIIPIGVNAWSAGYVISVAEKQESQ